MSKGAFFVFMQSQWHVVSGTVTIFRSGLAFQALDVARRQTRSADDHVDRLALEQQHPVGLVGNELEHDALEERRRAPVSALRLDHDLDARLVLHQLVGTKTGGIALQPGRRPRIVWRGVRLHLVRIEQGVVDQRHGVQRHRTRTPAC